MRAELRKSDAAADEDLLGLANQLIELVTAGRARPAKHRLPSPTLPYRPQDVSGVRYDRARELADQIFEHESVLEQQQRVLGTEHPHTLRTRETIARWRGELGDASRAVAEYERLLEDQERVLSPDDPKTLSTRHNLAHWRGESGDTFRAINDFEQLLSDQERVLGHEDPDTLLTRESLTYWQRKGAPNREDHTPGRVD